MKIRALQTAFAALLFLGIPAAHAWDPQGYWGLGGGVSKANFYSADFTVNSATVSESTLNRDTAAKIFVGFPLNRNLMAEISYTDLGRFHYKYSDSATGANVNLTYKSAGAGISLLPIAHLGDSFSIHGRIGMFVANTHSTPDANLPGYTLRSGSSSTLSFLVGAGAQFDFNSTYSLRADLESYGKVGDPSVGQARILVGSMNLVLSF